jgi:1A family penicillin-binding protein
MRVYDYSTVRSSKLVKQAKYYIRHLNWKKVSTWLLRIGAVGILLIAFLFIYYSRSLPDPNRLMGRNVPESTKIYDRNGGLLYEVHGEVKRTLVNLDQVSQNVQDATVAIEDKDFYKHSGISFTGLARSVWVDITTGSRAQGGSTITQQFVKNAILTKEKSLLRKLKEIILSIEIEARFSKQDILKLYLNEIPYGRNAYGIEAAAKTYFNKSAKDLTLAESAYLSALPQAPTRYNPMGPNRELLDGRQKYILEQMKAQGYITEEEHQQALNEKVTFVPVANSITAPHFVMYVQDYLADKYGELTLEQGGLKVHTSLDPELQKMAEEAVKSGVDKFAKRYNANNAALVAIDPKTGQILAMVGSKDYFGEISPAGCTPGKNCLFEPNVNVATSQRQPGSSFKPFVYATAFSREQGYSPASMLIDVTTNFGNFGGKNYIPHNYNGQSYGPVSMRKALAGSLNVPAVKTLALVGVENAVKTAHDLGITSPLQNCGLSLVLGGCEVRLVDHVAAYSVIANEGSKHEKTAILKVEGQEGKILEEYEEKSQQVLDPQAAYELINVMTDNNARSYVFGASSPLAYNRPVGCKTGTTQNWHDGWTLCFTPSIAIGVWAGNNDGTLLRAGADGVLVAAPIVNQVMNGYLKNKPAEEFAVPDGIQRVSVDSVSGKLPTENTPETRNEVFADYAVPKERDNVHAVERVDRTTGLPADDNTPVENIVDRPCLNLRSERPNDPNWEGPVRTYAAANGGCSSTIGDINDDRNAPKVSITQPSDDAVITQLPFQISINASGPNPITRIDIAIDGESVASLNQTPYTYTVNQKYDDGPHTITVKATDNQGATGSTSISFILAINGQPLSITDPSNNEPLVLPAQLTAEAATQYQQVTFYYQSGNTTKTIGQTGPSNAVGGNYEYTITWTDKPKAGSYKVFAKSNTGATSESVNVIILP